MPEKINHIPTENEAAWAVINARDAAQGAPKDSLMYDKTKRSEMIGQDRQGQPHMEIHSHDSGEFDMNGRYMRREGTRVKHFGTKTEIDPQGQLKSQEVTLNKYDTSAEGARWRELKTDNPFVVRMAEIAIANAIKEKAQTAKSEETKIAA